MNDKFECEEYLIEQVEMEREFNYIVTKGEEYICRLVPGYTSFELSPVDKAVDNPVNEDLIDKFAQRISDYYDWTALSYGWWEL